jgi:hypothetical protein
MPRAGRIYKHDQNLFQAKRTGREVKKRKTLVVNQNGEVRSCRASPAAREFVLKLVERGQGTGADA